MKNMHFSFAKTKAYISERTAFQRTVFSRLRLFNPSPFYIRNRRSSHLSWLNSLVCDVSVRNLDGNIFVCVADHYDQGLSL